MIAASELAEPILHHFSTSTHGSRQELGILLANETDWWFSLRGHITQTLQGGAAPWNVFHNDLLSPANWRENRTECLWALPQLVLAIARCYTFSSVAALLMGTNLRSVSLPWDMHSLFHCYSRVMDTYQFAQPGGLR